ncbi:MAG: thioredoxin-dependent thiol peroxidase [Nitrospirae bacterium]|nr:MAG: thioredoxin-dependent thiol peroxidase [Nitrospirota bacterium]
MRTTTSKGKTAKHTTVKQTAKARAKHATLSSSKPAGTSQSSPSSSSRVQLKVGQKAPTFSLPNQDGKTVRLSDYKGQKVVLYFYPKDDTPGCTKEACAFRDGLEEIQNSGAVVLGVSVDSVESHKKFAQKYGLNFPLLSDEDKRVVQAYGVWKERSLYGRKFMGVERTTFIIDREGKIQEIFPKVKVDNHLEEVLSELELLD